MQAHLSGKLHPRGDATSEPYKPAFHGGHLSCNMSHGGAATFRIFHLPWRRYSYSTQSSMTELLLSVSQHWSLRSEIILSGNLCSFHTLSLNNLANSFTIVFSVIVTKCDIFENLSYTTKIELWPFDTSNFIMKSTDICCHSLYSIWLGFNFLAGISALFFILWHWSHPSTYLFTSFIIPGHQ